MSDAADATSPRAVVYENGRWNGRTVRQWLPELVDAVVRRADPVRVVLFGSLARGHEDRDSDIDLLVVVDQVAPEDKRDLQVELRRATSHVPAPADFVVTDVAELERLGDIVGYVFRPALREGEVVYERPG